MAVQVLPEEGRFSLTDSEGEQRQEFNSCPHILVVDDENGPRQALRMLLKEDYEVHLAEGAEAALEILKSTPIELVVTDVSMPKVTGVELLREIKSIDTDIQVIIMTGFGQLETAMKAVEYGAFAYLEKPFDNQVMIDLVQSGYRKYRVERERRTFEKLALEADRFATLGRIVSGTMHDMGTPLTVLSSHIELLMMDPNRGDLMKRLETMKSQVQYCAELSRSTMNYLRHDSSAGGTQCLNTIIDTCLQVARPLLRENQVQLETHLDSELPSSSMDVVTMRQAVMNLITNACQAMKGQDEKRTLHISTWSENGQACLSVEDTGPGIPKELHAAIFETFFSTKGESGTGLGLGVVQNVVHRANGEIGVVEGKRGSGANFEIRLPIE